MKGLQDQVASALLGLLVLITIPLCGCIDSSNDDEVRNPKAEDLSLTLTSYIQEALIDPEYHVPSIEFSVMLTNVKKDKIWVEKSLIFGVNINIVIETPSGLFPVNKNITEDYTSDRTVLHPGKSIVKTAYLTSIELYHPESDVRCEIPAP